MRFCRPLMLIFCVGLTRSQAQSVKGVVTDNNGKPLAQVLVSLLKAADSSWLRSEATDGAGHYEMKAEAGNYLLQLTATGFAEHLKPVSIVAESVTTANYSLLAEQKLEGVTVTSKKPFIEARPGMMVVNIEQSAASSGSNALELLQRSPGVQVDPQGNISMRGKSDVAVYVDGRPSRLSGDQLVAYLRSMTAEEIAQLELITQPSAKYDAAGTAGIINIRTRTIRKQGLNGNVTVTGTQATNRMGNFSGRLTYKRNKLTLYASEYFNYVDMCNTLQVSRNYLDPATGAVTGNVYTDQKVNFVSRFHRIKAGGEYALSDKTTIGIRAQMPIGNPQVNHTNFTTIRDFQSGNATYNLGTRDMNNHWYEREVGLLAKHQFRDDGELTFDGFYVMNSGADHGMFINNATDATGTPIQASDLQYISFPVDVSLVSAKSDYTRALTKKTKLEAGLKYTDVRIDFTSDYQLPDSNGVFTSDELRTTRFLYDEAVSAAYTSLSHTFSDKLEAQVGLRAEQTNGAGRVTRTGESFKRSYLSLFPTLFASYKADSLNTYTFSYGRRLDRPNYFVLNPARNYIDKYSYSVGNPQLKPQFINNFELGYSYKGQLTATLSYMQISGVINDFFVQDDQTKTAYEIHDNIADFRQAGLSINYNKAMKPWWTMNVYGDFYLKGYTGDYYGTDFNQQGTFYSFNTAQQFILGKGWNAELNAWYNGPGLSTVFTRPCSMGSIDLGVSRKMINDSLVVKLAVNDVLGTQRYSASNRFANFDTDVSSTWDARRAVLSLSYSFGKNIEMMQRKADADRRM